MYLLQDDATIMLNLISKQSPPFNRQKFTGLNLEKLKKAISYFSYLHKNGEISDKAFETLVRYACNIFLENEVEILVQEALESKLKQFLCSKFFLEKDTSNDVEQIFDIRDLLQ